MILDKGMNCIVKRGRDFGKLCVVLETPKDTDSTVLVEGKKLKKCKKNILHLWPLQNKDKSKR